MIDTENIRVSVIIPTFNRREYISQAVSSVFLQTRPVQEIIVVDDGSEYPVTEVLQGLAAANDTLSVYRLPKRKGVSAARNFGLKKSSGDYVVFLDDDDMLDPEMIDSALSCFARFPGIDVVTCGSIIFKDTTMGKICGEPRAGLMDRHRKRTGKPFGLGDQSGIERKPFSHILLQGLQINANVAKKASLNGLLFSEELSGAGEDWFFWLDLASRGRKFKFNTETCSYVRRHTANAVMKQDFGLRSARCLDMVLEKGMAESRYDRFICHLRLLKRLALARKPGCVGHLGNVLLSPDLLVRHFFCFFGPRFVRKIV